MPPFPGFGGATYQSRSLTADCERCLNLYPEAVESLGAARSPVSPNRGQGYVLYGTPGKGLAGVIGNGTDQGAALVPADTFGFPDNSSIIWYAIVGNKLYSVAFHYTTGAFATGHITATLIGTVDARIMDSTQLFPAQILVLGDKWLFVVANGKAFVAAYGPPIAASALAASAPISFSVAGAAGAIATSSLNSGGTGYAVGDTGTVAGGTFAAVYTITGVAAGVVTTYRLEQPGQGNVVATGVATATGGAQPGVGTGFKINVLTVSTGSGIGYAVGDTGSIGGGTVPAQYTVLTVDGVGGVLTFAVTDPGAGYSPSVGTVAINGGVQPGVGVGFTVNITASAGGAGYAVGDTGTIAGGKAQAFYLITGVDANGSVLTYTLSTPGAGYATGDTIATMTGGPQPGAGSGFTIDITAVGAAAWAIARQTIGGILPGDYYAYFATFIDGYVIVNFAPNTTDNRRTRFYISGLLDPTTWSPLAFGAKEGNPDPIVGVFAAYENLLIFGTQTTEIWYDSGDLNFPFARITGGGVIEAGCASPYTIQKMDGTVIWLGTDARGASVAWMLRGLTPVRVSNHAIETRWSNYQTSFATSYCYQEDGHYFYVLHFPIENTTWVYDSVTGLWHERCSIDSSGAFRADFGRYGAFGLNIGHGALDYRNGNFYLQSIGYWDEAGTPIIRQRAVPPMVQGENWTFFSHARLLSEQGNPAASDAPIVFGSPLPTETPQYTLELSRDGGQTWGTPVPKTGSATDTRALIQWWRLGRARQLAIRLTSRSRINHAWVNFYIEGTPGSGT
jgi:hypothetical protein